MRFCICFIMVLDLPGCTQTLQTITHVTRQRQPHHRRIMRQLDGYMPPGTSVPAYRPGQSNHFLLFCFLVFRNASLKSLRSISGNCRFGTQVGDEPTSKSATSAVAFWRYACNAFGDTRRSGSESWAPKALWPYACSGFADLRRTGSQPQPASPSQPAGQPPSQPASQPAQKF